MDLSEEEIQRYARHILLSEVDVSGQLRLKGSRVLVVGAGGLGSPLALYLAAAGVGTLGIIDDDRVSLSNLQRQVIHDADAVGRSKVESVVSRVHALNPLVCVESYDARLTEANSLDLISRYDVVADGSDNSATRFLLNDSCFTARKPLVSGAILRFDGQVATFKGYLGSGHPCYRCLFEESSFSGLFSSCSEEGVLGALTGVVGSLQAVEVLKEILGIGDSLSGFLLLYDSLSTRIYKIAVPKSRTCPTCHHYDSVVNSVS